ncbi:WD40 repeat-like protein [Artomyces pyxidatus]|uniref:WD40 repeat-like protein n=1 Tax=Artomyces pyxidatus TaxID=48021 RepID=A0ACB8THJ9_9AGAM|nr:WD40 repeat-like protein [Artomyces pyxidatus]
MGEATTLSVHRCRFVDYSPSAVTALTFPPLPLPSIKGKKKADAGSANLPVGMLVVGRANGNIEICEWTGSSREVEAPQAWVVRKTLSGLNPSKVDSLALTIRFPHTLAAEDVPSVADLRLFSTGGGSELIEWDMERGSVRRTISSQGGSIWSIAANAASTMLALGCEDGSIHLLSIEGDDLSHTRRLDRSKSRILSIAWGPPIPRSGNKSSPLDTSRGGDSDDDDEDEWSDSWIVAGCSDSSLRKWDVVTGRVQDRMGTDKVRGERTLVWTVGVLGDGTIVSGDSLGMVKFWDSRTCTQLQSFEAHGADVLCLTIGPEGTTVFTSGVDQKTNQFSLIKTSSSGGSSVLSTPKRWVRAVTKRMHSHDVRALAIWPPYTPLPPAHRRTFPMDIAPILASAGLDMSLALSPAALPQQTAARVMNPLATSVSATFEDAYHRRIAYSSGANGTSAVHLAKQARLVMCMRETSLTIWRIPTRRKGEEPENETEGPAANDGWEKVLEMDLDVQTNLVSGAISDDGKWLVVSDYFQTKLFSLEVDSETGDVNPKRIRDFHSTLLPHLPDAEGFPSSGASALIFTPDSSKVVLATHTSCILIVDLGRDTGSRHVLRRFTQHRMKNVFVGERMVKGRTEEDGGTEMAEPDSAVEPDEDAPSLSEEPGLDKPVPANITRMAVSPDGQWLATTDDHRRTHIFNLDSIQHHSVLPTFPQPVHALAFSPKSPSLLVLGFANNTLELYDVEARQFPPWARGICSALPKRFTQLHDPVIGVTLAPAVPGKQGVLAMFWGSTWLCKVQFDAPVGWGGFHKKRRRGQNANEGTQERTQNFKLFTQYRQILLAEFMAPGELVVVERPLVDVLAKLPPAYFKPKYGAT